MIEIKILNVWYISEWKASYIKNKIQACFVAINFWNSFLIHPASRFKWLGAYQSVVCNSGIIAYLCEK